MKKQLQGEALYKRAEQLGLPVAKIQGVSRLNIAEANLQRRVQEVERSRRESRLWIVAVVSAIASMLSAAAAITAVCISAG